MADEAESYSRIRTFLGRSRRNETWYLTDEVEVATVVGRTQFDLRDVRSTGRDVVEIRVVCVLGSVDFIVPPGTIAVLDGSSILASARSAVAGGCDAVLPRLEIEATTVLGRVRIRSTRGDVMESLDDLGPEDEATQIGTPLADSGTGVGAAHSDQSVDQSAA